MQSILALLDWLKALSCAFVEIVITLASEWLPGLSPRQSLEVNGDMAICKIQGCKCPRVSVRKAHTIFLRYNDRRDKIIKQDQGDQCQSPGLLFWFWGHLYINWWKKFGNKKLVKKRVWWKNILLKHFFSILVKKK